jgi:hypothetical protein
MSLLHRKGVRSQTNGSQTKRRTSPPDSYSYVRNERHQVRGVWLSYEPRAVDVEGDVDALLARGINDGLLPEDEAADLFGPRRVVPNRYDDRGGIFVMFGSTRAPGE